MNLSSIDLNLFVVFEAIYSERNLTRAAEILNVTQPAMSGSLARLRDFFREHAWSCGKVPRPSAGGALLGGDVGRCRRGKDGHGVDS